MKEIIPGINIQWPWSDLLLSGKKSVETRTYKMPDKYIGKDLALIETPGPNGLEKAGIEKARIVGVIRFSNSFKYKSKAEWMRDKDRHLVGPNDPLFGWNSDKEKWGWVVESVRRIHQAPAPKKRGIIFASKCELSL